MLFKYKALSPGGEVEEGERSGDTRQAVILEFQREGLTLFSLEAVEGHQESYLSQPEYHLKGKIHPRVTSFFTRQLAELTKTGIPLIQALESLQRFTVSDQFKTVLARISSDISQGVGLDEAFAAHPKVFNSLYVSMLKAGMTSGNLSLVVDQLADYLERDQDLKDRIRSALSYPLFIFCFSIILIYGMISHLLPAFEPIWQQSGLQIENYPVTNFLMNLSHLTHNLWDEVLVLILLGLAGFVFYLAMRTPEAHRWRDRRKFKVPVLGPFLELTVMARIANTLGALLESGITLVESLSLTSDTAGSITYRDALLEISQKVREGETLSHAVEATQVFPPLMIQMIGIGEESGELSTTLPRLGKYYEGQLNLGIKTMSSLIEPFTMVLVGGVVFTFVIGVFLPIMGVVGSLQNQL